MNIENSGHKHSYKQQKLAWQPSLTKKYFTISLNNRHAQQNKSTKLEIEKVAHLHNPFIAVWHTPAAICFQKNSKNVTPKT